MAPLSTHESAHQVPHGSAHEAADGSTHKPRRGIRVLVVDDSMFMRKLITGVLQEDPDIAVVGQARDGEEALRKAAELDPDVITLDVEMPRLDGIHMLERLMRQDPRPVVMVSGLTRENAEATVKSLRLGAVDFLTKPSGSVSPDLPRLRKELQAKVRAAAALGRGGVRRLVGLTPPIPGAPPPALLVPPVPAAPVVSAHPDTPTDGGSPAATATTPAPAIPGGASRAPATPTTVGGAGRVRRLAIIGASTGGPGALHFLMARLASRLGAKAGAHQPGTEAGAHRLGTKELGAKAPVAIIIVQHIPPGFSTAVAHSLTQTTANAIRVREACITRDESAPLFEVPTLLKGCEPWPLHAEDVVLAPGGYHVRVVEGPGVELSLDPPVAGVRPAVDVTLLSAVPVMGPRILAVILTGMGTDGLRGATAVRQAGGRVIAQDQATSVVYGMPRAVVEAGQADEVLPLEGIADALASWWNGDAA